MVQHHFFSATRCWKCGGCCRCGRCGLHCTRNCGRMVRLSLKSLEAVSKPEGCRLSCPFQGAVPAQVKQCPLAPLVLAASTTYLPPGQTPPTHPPPQKPHSTFSKPYFTFSRDPGPVLLVEPSLWVRETALTFLDMPKHWISQKHSPGFRKIPIVRTLGVGEVCPGEGGWVVSGPEGGQGPAHGKGARSAASASRRFNK